MTLRWEERPTGEWWGFTGELAVAKVVQAETPRRWDWKIDVHRPSGWRKYGHGTSALAARRSADAYWLRWLEAAALRPDLERLASAAVPAKAKRPAKR